MRTRSILFTLPLLTMTIASFAQGESSDGKTEPDGETREFTTRHEINVGADKIAYTAVAGEIRLENDAGQPRASIFTIAYLKEGAPAASRPLTFIFNGGPGSSAVWLHLGAFGPRRIALPANPTNPGAPPYSLEDNPHTLLPATDMVFVDPVGSGYSRALGDAKAADFWGVDEDAGVIADFIRAYLTQNRRWGSPRYLAGESYGTIRSAVLVRELQLDVLDNVALNGVVLISPAIDGRHLFAGGSGHDLPYVTYLPSYAAVAAYHDRLPEKPTDVDAFLAEVREFAATDYLMALFKGDALDDDERSRIAGRLNRYTGLDEGWLLRSNLRIGTGRFLKELLRDQGATLAIHDGRFLGRDPDSAGEQVAFDPFLPAIAGPFVSVINSYVVDELGVETDEPYEVFAQRAGGRWKRSAADNGLFAGAFWVTPYLTEAAAANKDFRIFVASGYHDLTTTFFASEYMMDHSSIAKERITLRNYHGGHMMYLHPPSHQALSDDIRAFIAGSGTN